MSLELSKKEEFDMKAKPVRRYRVPAYPTKLQVLADPKVLAQNVPAGWRSGSLIAGAASVFLAANLLGCADKKSVTRLPASPIVAPLFVHGEGRGVTGCIVITPPVFLSEEEALQVITEELKKRGIELSEKNVEWDVSVPWGRDWTGLRETPTDTEQYLAKDSNERKPLKLDALDPKHKIGVEYVSKYEGMEPNRGSTVDEYDTAQAAVALSRAVKQEGKKGIYFGVFYDPLGQVEERHARAASAATALKRWEMARKKVREESIELLRQQVKDFIDWLKAQGAI